MNVQLSVVVWTVICFSVLMLILHNLLFKPVLSLFDRRREKIEAAEKKRSEYERARLEHQTALENKRAQLLERQKQEAADAVLEIQNENKKQMEDAKREHLENVQAYRESIGKEYARMIEVLAPEMQKAADALADRIISHKV